MHLGEGLELKEGVFQTAEPQFQFGDVTARLTVDRLQSKHAPGFRPRRVVLTGRERFGGSLKMTGGLVLHEHLP